jgi:hypothetical protein
VDARNTQYDIIAGDLNMVQYGREQSLALLFERGFSDTVERRGPNFADYILTRGFGPGRSTGRLLSVLPFSDSGSDHSRIVATLYRK